MEKGFGEQKFRSAEEEIAYLKQMIAQKEAKLLANQSELMSDAEHQHIVTREQERMIEEELRDYTAQDADRVLHEHFRLPDNQIKQAVEHIRGNQEIVLPLSPETHDKQIEALIARMHTEGILNTIQIVKQMNDPHLDDDFHRFLVQYIKKGLPTIGLKESAPETKALKRALYEVSLPERQSDSPNKTLKEVISSMEQLYSGLLSVDGGQFALELAVSDGGEEFVFYVSVPETNKLMFEKQFLAIFPGAKAVELADDYNVFNADGVSVASTAVYSRNDIYPIKNYTEFDFDPLNVLLNAFSHIEKDGEGAAIQIVCNPVGEYYTKEYKNALGDIQKGTKVKEAIDIRHTFFGRFTKTLGEMGKGFADEALSFNKKKDDKEKDKNKDNEKVIDQIVVEQITNKIQSPILEVNVRLVASAPNRERAERIMSEIEATFNQFDNSLGNALKFNRAKDNASLRNILHKFSYRLFDEDQKMPMSIKELNTLMHFPGDSITAQPQLKQSKANTAPAPLGLPSAGLFLGTNIHRNQQTQIYMSPDDRLRHFYVIGQTGTGKSTMLRNMIIQDIKAGNGVCFIDPHGSDVQDILAHIPKDRYEDVIYFDPSHTERPMALNMLEYNRAYPEQKTFVVNELFSIFQKLYGAVPESMGPMFEQYFRNATMLVIEDPDSGCTLLDVSRVMSDKKFRELKLSRCKNPVVVQFWKEIAEKAGGEGSLQNMVPYITSKFDVFLANDIMRPIIAQEESSFNFREIMDSKKILLVNLAKGRLGDINSSLIGLILVGKILMAALSRVDSFGTDMAPFYLYIDEFQNITTPSIATILSEARKYKLSLTVAHQFIAQLDQKIKDAVFGNVGSMAVFRVGAEDSEFLQKQFDPVFKSNDIMNIENMNCYIKMLSQGRPVRPFNVGFSWPTGGNEKIVLPLKELSYLKYGEERELVEEEIAEKYKKLDPTLQVASNDLVAPIATNIPRQAPVANIPTQTAGASDAPATLPPIKTNNPSVSH